MKIRDENICKAAIKVFMRYGIRRATMNDIAAEAGLVRQTLYKIYPNKDAVLCAAIRFYSDQSLDAVKEGWKRAHSLADKLDVYFEHAICASFAIVRASPEAADMIGGYTPAGKAEIRRVQAQKAEAIAEILAPYGTGSGWPALASTIMPILSNMRRSACATPRTMKCTFARCLRP